MSGFDKEMQDALRADAEKLRAMGADVADPVFLETGLERSASNGATTGSHHNTSTSVKALDLSRVLQHALLAGQKGVWWVDYDPTSNPAYQRITEWLHAKASGWLDIESDPPEPTREEILCYEPSAHDDNGKELWVEFYYVTTGYALKNQYACGTEDQNPTHWQPLLPPPGEEDGDDVDTIYQDAHRASVRSTIATSMKREDALRAENAELKRLITHMVDAIGKGAVDSEEIVPVPGDGPPYRFHEEWAHYARSALATKGGEDD